MTLAELAREKPTLDQLEIFSRADQLILARNPKGKVVGRFFGGQLTKLQIEQLTPKKVTR